MRLRQRLASPETQEAIRKERIRLELECLSIDVCGPDDFDPGTAADLGCKEWSWEISSEDATLATAIGVPSRAIATKEAKRWALEYATQIASGKTPDEAADAACKKDEGNPLWHAQPPPPH